jgi:hypothetical protein
MGAPTSVTFDDLREGDALARLVDAGESEFVERKVAEPTVGWGPIVSALANTAGGWLLVGVADKDVDGRAEIAGFAPPGRADIGDWLRDKLATQLGEVPSFRAEMLRCRGRDLGVVRVPPSTSGPHFMLDGRVYIHENRRTVLVTRQAQLLEILARASASHKQGLDRLSTSGAAPVTEAAVGIPRQTNALQNKAMPIVLRVSPAYVPPSLRRYVTSRVAVQRSERFVVQEALTIHDRPRRDRPYPQSKLHDSGHSVRSTIDGLRWKGVTVAQDGRGVLGVSLDGVNTDGVFIFIDTQLREWLTPALSYFSEALTSSGAIGPATLAFSVGGITGTSVFVSGRHTGFPPEAGNWFDTTLAWPEPGEVSAHTAVVDALLRAMARAAGTLLFDDD